MEELIQNAIGVITGLLLWPTILLLLYGIGFSLFSLGNMLVESFQRKGKPETMADPRNPSQHLLRLYGIQEWKKQLTLDNGAPLWILHDRTEAALKKKIDRIKIWVKFGPALGLAGTLIPLGAALQAVGVNNMKLLSDHLSVAFGSTILGLTAGVICMMISTSYERWYGLDLAEIRQAIENQEEKQNS